MKIRHYADSHSLGYKYIFGLNVYRSDRYGLSLDLILGKHVFALIKGEK